MTSTTKLNVFVGAAHLSLLLGYLSSAFENPGGSRYRLRIDRWIIWSAVVSIVLLFPTSAGRTGSWVPDAIKGMQDPGSAYAFTNERIMQGEVGSIEYVRIFFGPLIAVCFPVLVFYWPRLRRTTRMAGVLATAGTIVLFLAMGTNKAIGDTAVLMVAMTLASLAAGIVRVRLRTAIIIITLAAVALSGFVVFFTSTMAGRAGSVVAAGALPQVGAVVDDQNFMVAGLPDVGKIAVYGLTMYSSIGYYAVYLSLNEPFEPTFGLGNSPFLTRQYSRLTGDQHILRMPYPNRIEKYGWDAQVLWSSIYPWLASDLSFPGVVIFLFFVGRYFARAWLDTLVGINPLAIVAFSQFLLLMFYLPANNQLFQSGEGFSTAVIIFLAWLYTRRSAHSARVQRSAA
jgi:hypothetical protein